MTIPLSTREFLSYLLPAFFWVDFWHEEQFRWLIAKLWLRTRRHTESRARRAYMRARVHLSLRISHTCFECQDFESQAIYARRASAPYCGEEWKNSVFWQTPKKQLLKCGRRARRRAASYARLLPRARTHTTDSAQRGDRHRSRCSTPTHTRTFTPTRTYIRTKVHVYMQTLHKGHTKHAHMIHAVSARI